MFFRLYKTRLKCLCKNYESLFWSFAFPILLAIFFYMGFYNLSSTENLETIPIAIVTEENTQSEFLSIIKGVEIKEDKKLFDVQLLTLQLAEEQLDKNEIAGYIVNLEEPVLHITENGMNQTIIKSFIDSYIQTKNSIINIVSLNPDVLSNGSINELIANYDFVVDGGKQSKSPNYVLVYFYSLIALTCIFGCNWGFREMVDIQADQSAIGARINVAPIHKMKLLVSNLLAAFTIHFTSILVLLAFLDKVLRVELGSNLGLILLICFMGSLCGISLGAMVCVSVKANVKVKEAILTIIGLGGGFLSGMMLVEMKYLVATKAPILGYINPSNLITDAFYCLYYYEGYSKFLVNICMLGILTILFGMITYQKIRRKEYASI